MATSVPFSHECSVKELSQLASAITDDHFQNLVELAFGYIQSRLVSKDAYIHLKNSSTLTSRVHDLLFSAIIHFIRRSLKLENYRNDCQSMQQKLIDDFKLPPTKTRLFEQSLIERESRFKLIHDVETLVPCPSVVIKVDWRLDVLIGSSDPSEEMKLVIIFKFTTNKGIYSCHCDLSVFHQLRVAVATSLKELYSLNSKK